MPVQIKRIYETASPGDGYRVLVDRLWARGIKKDAAQIDQWLKEVAPSSELRKWFSHDPGKWGEFVEKYQAEISGSAAFKELKALVKKHKHVTLLYSARDELHNQAAALLGFLKPYQ